MLLHHINNLQHSINFTMEEKGNGELALHDTLLKKCNTEI